MEDWSQTLGTAPLLLIAAGAIALILLLIIVFKVHAFLTLIIVSLLTAFAAQIPVSAIATTLTTGLGGTLGSVALLVALGAMIITWCCEGDTAGFAERLDRCRVRWRPGQMGLEREALKQGLVFAPEYMEGEGVDSVLRHEPVTGVRFDAVWKFLAE